jgi:hypothetical protein
VSPTTPSLPSLPSPSPLLPLPHHWLALCLVTESNRPPEWPYIAQVIANRASSKRYPNSLRDVIRQPMQFSAFNETIKLADLQAFRGVFERHVKPVGVVHYSHALDWAVDWVGALVISEAITLSTLHYWSPVSMRPRGSRPAWAKTAKRLYTPEGVDPDRFVFAEEVG